MNNQPKRPPKRAATDDGALRTVEHGSLGFGHSKLVDPKQREPTIVKLRKRRKNVRKKSKPKSGIKRCGDK